VAGKESAEDFNFVSQCFFLALRAVSLGPVQCASKYKQFMQQLGHVQRQQRDNVAGAAEKFDALLSHKLALDVTLQDDRLLDLVLRFVSLQASWIVKQCFPPGTDTSPHAFKMPLPESPNACLAAMPQHYIEDIVVWLIYVAQNSPDSLRSASLSEIMTMCVAFVASKGYIRSPHLRCQVSELVFYVFVPQETAGSGRQGQGASAAAEIVLRENPLAQQHLSAELLVLYGDAEHTGAQEAVTHRIHITHILKYLWKIPEHHRTFRKVGDDEENFVKFANGLLNHINSLVVDSLALLPDIKRAHEERKDAAAWSAKTEDERGAADEMLKENESQCASWMQLANETIHMLRYLTEEIREPFLQPALIDRLASMLNSVLVKLAGSKGVDLKVDNPERYNFHPKVLLEEIMHTFLHFAAFDSFHTACGKNAFYDASAYRKASTLVQRMKLFGDADRARFEALWQKVSDASTAQEDLEGELGDIPEEFLDPLMCTLMLGA
jgi:ubiquitin conjugation factor E4 B